MKRVSKEEIEALRDSMLFDENYYLEQYPDVKAVGMDPVEHYLWIGKAMGRRPGPVSHSQSSTKASEGAATICRSVNGGLPDLFDLRSKAGTGSRSIVAFVSNFADLNRLRAMLTSTSREFDLILTVPHSLSEVAPTAIGWANLSVVVYPDQFGSAHALLHIANSGSLAKYRSVCWLDASLSQANARNAVTAVPNPGLTASSYDIIPAEHAGSIGAAMGVFAARLGRKKPAPLPACPVGDAILIPDLILEQLRAYRIQPAELGSPASSRWLLGTLLSVICDEAGLEKLTWESSSAKRPTGDRRVQAIAFYLPQFHPIPENDQWWGKGFTEWTNVVNARPLFRSHFQPQLPSDLGFYDLRTPETQQAQADLAKEHGISGFCYYYYWFNGRKLLNQPIEQMLRSGKPNFPFCVCWANENWSRNWDGQNKHVLIEQHYSLESNKALILEFIEMMKDPRYIKYNGRPVLLVYRIRIIPEWLETAEMWREECRRAGIGEIHLCAVRFGLEPLDGPPEEFGVDSYVLFPPHESEKIDARHEVPDLVPDFNGTIFRYDEVAAGDLKRFEDGYPWPVHRGAMLGWDNTARRPRDSRIFVGATPARFHHWLKNILDQEDRHNASNESLIFINAWNEWAEGTTLEPSTRFGRGYLQAARSALSRQSLEPANVAPSEPRQGMPSPPTKRYGGAVARLEDVPTILICAHVVSDKIFGGERSFLDLLQALSGLCLNVIVAIPSDNHPHYRQLACSLVSEVVVIPYDQWRDDRLPDEGIVDAFREIIRDRSISLVYANTIVLLEPLVAARREGCKTVVHARELINADKELAGQIGLSTDDIIKSISDRADYLIGNSQTTATLFHRDGSTFCVPNVVDGKELNLSNRFGNVIKFGIISSNIPKKGVADFVEVARWCEAHCPRARFIVIGPENRYVEHLKRQQLPGNLEFAGYAANPAEAMSKVNVILSLSHVAESFGRTIAEAQAARRPVIAYDHGAVPELVDDAVTGILVPPFEVEKAAEAVRHLCENPDLIHSMGEAGRAKILFSYGASSLRENLWSALRTILGSPIPMRETTVPRTTIIVPVFNAFDEVRDCLASLTRQVDFDRARVLLIDDASTDPRIPDLLQSYESVDGFTLLTNKSNVGFTGTINIGIRWAGEDDVLLLNSDTIVTPGFVEGLRRTATSDARIGTATAMSDNAGAFSFPLFNQPNPKPSGVPHDEHAAAILRRTASCSPVEVPTGSGFCMYVRRALFDVIGLFDEETFPRGYGEENDFCMRALERGWRNVISPHAYVYHVRTASFGSEKEILTRQAIDKVTRRHPDYAARAKAAFSSPEIQALRAAAQG